MTTSRDPAFVHVLKTHLQQECRLHEEYRHVLEEERKAVTRFDQTQIDLLAHTREALVEKIEKLAAKRSAFFSQFPDAEQKRLSELIVARCHPDEVRILAPMVADLKRQIASTQQLSRECNQIVDFSMKFVSGALSLLRSASQSITRAYTRRGIMKEQFEAKKSHVLSKA